MTFTRCLAGAAVGAVLLAACSAPPVPPGSSSQPTTRSATSTAPAPRKAQDPLTGLGASKNEVIAVKVENTPAARPQLGLDAADLVFVEEVEAGITRLIAVYHTRFPARVGPVRSARNTDLELLPLFGRPGLVYSGANRKVQARIRKSPVVPIERSDRDHSRRAPHNVMVNLRRLAARHQVGRVRDVGLAFAATDPGWQTASRSIRASAAVGHDRFRFDYAKGRYTVGWNGRTYRAPDGALTCDNVIVMKVRNRRDRDTTSRISIVSSTIGRGKASVFRDGRRIDGTWSRLRPRGPLSFTLDGRAIPLKPGRTWILLSG